jgi:hypothetical protein
MFLLHLTSSNYDNCPPVSFVPGVNNPVGDTTLLTIQTNCTSLFGAVDRKMPTLSQCIKKVLAGLAISTAGNRGIALEKMKICHICGLDILAYNEN